jgi:glycerophosphoryl diester phosphodiesterase
MPTLEEVLVEFRGIPISVDVKQDDPTVVERLYRLVSASDAENTVTVGSFHDRLIHRLRRLGYQGPTALTQGEVAVLRLLPRVVARRTLRGRSAMIPRTHGRIRLDTSRFIRRCRALGLRVDYWVVNEPDAARELLTRGATGIITDDPSRIAPVMEEFYDVRQT